MSVRMLTLLQGNYPIMYHDDEDDLMGILGNKLVKSMMMLMPLFSIIFQMKEPSQKSLCDVFKLFLAFGITLTFLCDFPSLAQAASTSDGVESPSEEKGSGSHHKLLIIMLDG